jgi:hypothetical protein
MDGDFVLDGEIVALDEQGRPSFQLLQNGRPHPLSAYLYEDTWSDAQSRVQTEIGAYIQQNPTKAVFMDLGVGFVFSRRLWKQGSLPVRFARLRITIAVFSNE